MKNSWLTYWRDNGLFWSCMCMAILLMGIFLYEHGQIDSHLALNAYHHPVADFFFKYYTYIGGGLPCYIGLALLFYKLRTGVFVLGGQAVAALLTQPLKHLIARPRPLTLFRELGLQLPDTVDGVHLWDAYNSFPSGHTSAIFAFIGCLAALLPPRYRKWQLPLCLLALLGAYSRIYLSQHFLEDTLAGAPIGALATALAYTICYQRDWGEYPVYQFKRNKAS
ncbi:MAG: phosphatase PAP2 family protein [Paludibacteraceae bacterium]|nr:phosphatase PAP2 family protein [Paludibacteraceae bacterium]